MTEHNMALAQLEPGEKAIIEFKDVNKWYGDFHVLKNIDFSIKKGERIVVFGTTG